MILHDKRGCRKEKIGLWKFGKRPNPNNEYTIRLKRFWRWVLVCFIFELQGGQEIGRGCFINFRYQKQQGRCAEIRIDHVFAKHSFSSRTPLHVLLRRSKCFPAFYANLYTLHVPSRDCFTVPPGTTRDMNACTTTMRW